MDADLAPGVAVGVSDGDGVLVGEDDGVCEGDGLAVDVGRGMCVAVEGGDVSVTVGSGRVLRLGAKATRLGRVTSGDNVTEGMGRDSGDRASAVGRVSSTPSTRPAITASSTRMKATIQLRHGVPLDGAPDPPFAGSSTASSRAHTGWPAALSRGTGRPERSNSRPAGRWVLHAARSRGHRSGRPRQKRRWVSGGMRRRWADWRQRLSG
jgi:hypothetical protein